MTNKVYITNFAWNTNNYGAVLTAFALISIIKNAGVQACNVYNPITEYVLTQNKCDIFQIFKDKYIEFTEHLKKYFQFVDLNKTSEAFITGSDQVFRLGAAKKYIYQYLLDFADSDKKKIAFSASFGVDKKQFLKETPQDVIAKMKRSLKTFDYLSVREKSGVEICRDVFDVEAKWIIDPVFILDKSNYEKLIENAETENFSRRIVSYVLDTGKDYKKVYKYLRKKYNQPVIEMADSNYSIENWLKAIRDCELFITDSFHGMCFALIFNKPFICLANTQRGYTRFDSILEMLGIENQCLDDILDVLSKDCIFKIDYGKVNANIEKQRQAGLDFLKGALEAPVTKQKEKTEAKLQFLEEKICEMEEELTLKNIIKEKLWQIWRVIFHKCLPKFIKNFIQKLRGKK